MINIISISSNSVENITRICLEVSETVGNIERIKEKLIVKLPGKYNTIDDDLRTKIDEELTKSGFNYSPVIG